MLGSLWLRHSRDLAQAHISYQVSQPAWWSVSPMWAQSLCSEPNMRWGWEARVLCADNSFSLLWRSCPHGLSAGLSELKFNTRPCDCVCLKVSQSELVILHLECKVLKNKNEETKNCES